MKYMLLIYNNREALEALPEDELQAVFADVDRIMGELTESGEWVGGEGLAAPSEAKTVRVRDGVVATTDGPFAESKEQFAGFLTVDVESEERAVEIAASWPDAKYWALEVRAVMGGSGDEM
jgi:hypothetical protein